MSDEPFLIKNLFNRDSVGALGVAIAQADATFDVDRFLDLVLDTTWEDLELKERMRHVSIVLRSMLPDDYRSALGVLLDAVPFAGGIGFPAMVLSDFVEEFGTGDWDASVPALARFTTLVSAEFAIRPFIASDQDRTLAQMLAWAGDPDPAVRRLATEGSRPRLPWGMRLQALVVDPRPALPILEELRSDPDENVRRSVANHLNDIAKDHPDVVLEVLRCWGETPDEYLPALRKHALRTLLKRGDPEAMTLLGFRPDADVELRSIRVDPDVAAIGGSARLHFALASTSDGEQPVMVDYAVHYVKANGSTAPKVFKLKTFDLEPRSVVELSRKLSFVQVTTRTHRPGTHRVEVQVNGTVIGGTDFELVD